MRAFWLAIAVLTTMLTLQSRSTAGEISLVDGETIRFSGPVEFGDSAAFERLSSQHAVKTVILDSGGGVLSEGLKMGDIIRERRLVTRVLPGTACASACGYMWLAGRERIIEGDGKVGFHAVYNADSNFEVSASGNALAGAYMARLGLSDFVVIYATEAAPREMRWLSPSDAQFIGVEVAWRSSQHLERPAPILTRAEIARGLESDAKMLVIKRRFPDFFAKVTEIVFGAQAHGQKAEAVAWEAILKALPDLERQLYATASDDVIFDSFQITLRYMEYLQKSDLELCASYAGASADRLKLFASRPDFIQAEYDKWFLRAFGSSVQPARSVSKSDQRYLSQKLIGIKKRIVRSLSPSERKRFLNSKSSLGPELACKTTILFMREMMRDMRLLRIVAILPVP